MGLLVPLFILNMSLSDIIEGTYNNITNRKEELSAKRMIICKECPLYLETVLGAICNPDLFINPETKEVFGSKKPGNVRGCMCILQSKTRVEQARCPGKKW